MNHLGNMDQWFTSDYCTDNVGIDYNDDGVEAEITENIQYLILICKI